MGTYMLGPPRRFLPCIFCWEMGMQALPCVVDTQRASPPLEPGLPWPPPPLPLFSSKATVLSG